MMLGVTQHHHYPLAPVNEKLVVGEIPVAPPGFVDRTQHAEVASILASESYPRICALIGMRGAGKSQIAAAYAQRCIDADFAVVAWLNAETRLELSAGLAELAEKLDVSDPDGDPARSQRRLREHLAAAHGSKLLIFDNANDPDQLQNLLKSLGSTQILITSTDKQFSEVGIEVKVGSYLREQSVAYLSDRTGLPDVAGAADRVADQLGDLPLALTAAAATIRARNYDYHEYLRILERSVAEALRRRPGLSYPLHTEQALSLAIESVVQADPSGASRRLLQIMSLFSPQGTTKALLLRIPLVGTEALEAAIERCVRGSILTDVIGAKALRMHRLIGRVVRERWIDVSERDSLVTGALSLLSSDLSKDSGITDTAVIIAAATHLERLWESLVNGSGKDELLNATLSLRAAAVARLADRTGDLAGAIDMGERVVRDCEQELDNSSRLSFIARRNLAHAFAVSGKLDVAAEMLEDTVVDQEFVLGPDHPDALASSTHLAGVLCSAGQHRRSIALLRANIATYARTLSPRHPDALTARINFAAAHRLAGQLDRAIHLYKDVLLDCESTLGARHEMTLTCRNNLAAVYREAGNPATSIGILEDVLEDNLKFLGPDNRGALVSRSNLASAYEDAGQPQRAIALFERNLIDRENILGAEHPDTMISRHNLAGAFESAGELDKAKALHERNLADRERILGIDHPHTQISRNSLACVLLSQGHTKIAVATLERGVADCERTLPPDHPQTLTTRHNLAVTYERDGSVDRAILLFERCFADRQRVLGMNHPHTRESLACLADVYLEVGRPFEAVRLRQVDLERCMERTSSNHPDTLAAANDLAYALLIADEIPAAIMVLEPSLVRSIESLGVHHPLTEQIRTSRDVAYRILNRLMGPRDSVHRV